MKAVKVVESVSEGALSIELRRYADGRYGFEFNNPDRGRVRVRCSDLEDARKQAREMILCTNAGKLNLAGMTPELFARFLIWEGRNRTPIKTPDLVTKFLKVKESKGRSEWTLRDLRELEKFAKAFPGFIDEIPREQVETWLDSHGKEGKPIGPRRWNNLLATIKALYRFARKSGHLTTELEPAEHIEKRRTVSRIETYTAAELVQILAVVPDEWLPVVALGAFAGIRPEESCPDPKTKKAGLRWENVLWTKRKIDVPRDVAKDRRRRFVPMCDALVAFLQSLPEEQRRGDIAPRRRLANQIRHWRRKSKVPWKRDGLRHSYASYRLALTKNIHELALEMGNSVKIIHDFYLDLKHEEEADEWFGIRPSGQGSNIIRLAQDGTNAA